MLPRHATLTALIFATSHWAAGGESPAPVKMLGFSEARAKEQAALEGKFDAQLKAEDQRAWVEQMASAPNHVGSPHDKANADFMLEQFRAWGWETQLETFDVLYPTPTKVALELVEPGRFTARLREPAVEGDRTSGKGADGLPPYNIYGADGDVTGELVYVNQGMPDDYKELARHGVDVKGRIVIARYGGGWRGLKPKLAYEHGAIGCLIYSDPQQDGYGAGEAYPKGGHRPADGVQRGSVMDMPIYPGDPLTPGVGATKDAKRLPLADAKTVLKIPVLPISHADAQPLLAALGGPVAPAGWRGALPITYHLGPGPAKVHLTVQSEWSLKTIYNVIAKLAGREFPDEWVVRGNHHDGWVMGAEDPLSGNVALMAEAKAIGALAKEGWRPKRTLVYASWDAEEPGLIGSTEWAEAHADELSRKAVIYVNSDGNGRGFLQAAGSHSLQTLVNQVAAGVKDPETGVSVLERRRARMMVDGNKKGAEDEAKRLAKLVAGGAQPPLAALGSGSDYTVFLDHLGIASLNLGFGGESETDGVYHSLYDSYDHYARFGDPGFVYGVVLSKTIGRIVLRTAEADVLPLRFGDFSEAVLEYAGEVHKLADNLRESTELQQRLLDEKLYALAADPTKTEVPPPREAAVPVLNLAPLDNAVLRLKKSAKACDDAPSGGPLPDARRAELNALLRDLEQTLVSGEGLPQRPWFRHMIYAPGLQTGYGTKTLPGVREAIEDRRWPDAERYAGVIAGVLNAYSDRMDKVTALLKDAALQVTP
ncbi:MAG TPA: transferrin receptor-like dimerization domain-containing protein [Chthoniobacteraceae bacterium]|jgi:N-acetylated-alpha-linked acidic dipeptidase|nr:transferrin receptor-like dimerization domain-containing protein [Chthoniobacteraceae bacterium]